MTDEKQQDTATDGPTDSQRTDRAHLADVEGGCGCAEVWEHLSEQRAANAK